ncbi:hypothetical protein ACCS64_40115, partial [Rhizobium ruizarguesonis]
RKFEEIDPLLPLVGGWSRFRTKTLLSRLSEIYRSGKRSAATSLLGQRQERSRHTRPVRRHGCGM